MKHQIKQVFHSPKFVVGFILFAFMVLMAIFYPLFSSIDALESMSKIKYLAPGTYINLQDAINAEKGVIELDVVANRVVGALSEEEKDKMVIWLETYGGAEAGSIDKSDAQELISTWNSKYDSEIRVEGTSALRKEYQRIANRVSSLLETESMTVQTGEDESVSIKSKDFIGVNDVANKITFPLGTDNFGRDVLTELTSAVGTSLEVGLIAGIIATLIGLTLGLLAGYVGGTLDNFITFITNLFTVIPSFVLLILISYAIGAGSRSVEVVAIVIGLTAWPWTCRSVRSQVVSLRNRDHVNLSKLSGHSMPRIIVGDVLPYVASYVVMAFILQISSGILAEAQLSMLGLGPSTTKIATLGLMMNWSQQASAWQTGAWWAFIPVIVSIALVTFSLNLMNTGLDQVFNPQLRDS